MQTRTGCAGPQRQQLHLMRNGYWHAHWCSCWLEDECPGWAFGTSWNVSHVSLAFARWWAVHLRYLQQRLEDCCCAVQACLGSFSRRCRDVKVYHVQKRAPEDQGDQTQHKQPTSSSRRKLLGLVEEWNHGCLITLVQERLVVPVRSRLVTWQKAAWAAKQLWCGCQHLESPYLRRFSDFGVCKAKSQGSVPLVSLVRSLPWIWLRWGPFQHAHAIVWWWWVARTVMRTPEFETLYYFIWLTRCQCE